MEVWRRRRRGNLQGLSLFCINFFFSAEVSFFSGVATYIMTKDILDPDRFWVDELSRANKGLFSSTWAYAELTHWGN